VLDWDDKQRGIWIRVISVDEKGQDQDKIFCKECGKAILKSNFSKHQPQHPPKEEKVGFDFDKWLEEVAKPQIKRMAVRHGDPSTFGQRPEWRGILGSHAFSRASFDEEVERVSRLQYGKIREIIEDLPYSLVFDEWSRFCRSFIGVMLSCAKGVFLLGLIDPSEMRRDASALSRAISRVHVDALGYDIDPIRCSVAVTDCCPTVKKACRLMGLTASSCPPHVANKALEKTIEESPELREIFLGRPTFAERVARLHHNFKFSKYCAEFHPELKYENLATFSLMRWADISRAVNHCVVMEPAIRGFQNCRGGDSKPITPEGYVPFTDELFASLRKLDPVLAHIRGIIFDMQQASLVIDGATVRSDAFFYALQRLTKLSEVIPGEFEAAGFKDAGLLFQEQIRKRLLKYHASLKLQMRALLMNPAGNLDGALEGMPETFEKLAERAEDELEADCVDAQIGGPPVPVVVERGLAAPRVHSPGNHYIAWKKAKAPSMVAGRTVTMYWESETAPQY
jgi:hypothetical protein